MRINKSVSMFCRLNMEYTLVRSQYSFFANQMTERSWRCSSASIICPMCIMVLGMKKKAEPFVTYLVPRYRQAPNRINKYEQFTPHSVNFYLLILNGLSIWRFSEQRIRAKAQYLISI